MTVKVIQIYYNQESKNNLHPLCEPYNNEGQTDEFFEDSVIEKCIDNLCHKNCDYFGVVSHQINKKVSFLTHNTMEQLFEVVSNGEFDIYALHWNNQDHSPMVATGHPYLEDIFDLVLNRLGWNLKWRNLYCPISIYSNHFIARSDIYEAYVKTFLSPVMNIMRNKTDTELQKLLWANSQYKIGVGEELFDCAKKYSGAYFPHHAFVCERLINYFIFGVARKKFKITCLK